MRLVKLFLLVIGMATFMASGAHAQTALEGGTGLFFVDKAKTLGDGAVGIGLNLESQRYWVGNVPVAESAYHGSVTAGFGDRLEISLAAPYRSQNPEQGESVSGMSDGMAKVKYELLHHDEYGLRIAAAALATLPLGDKDKGLGAGQAFPGVALMLDKEYENVTWSFNLGYVAADKAERGYNPYTIYGVGVEWFPIENPLALIAEVSGRTWSSVKEGRDDSASMHVGARYYVNDNVSAQVAYGSWTGGEYSSYRYVAGVTVGFGLGRKKTGAGSTGLVGGTGPDGTQAGAGEGGEGTAMTISLGSALFAFDKATLSDEAKAVLDANVAALNERPDATVVIEGHADATGPEAYNDKLGMRRALAAKKYLTEKGIAAERMTPVSYGETRPVADNATREGRAKNRRADFVIQGK